jgi:hypothetical protein
MRLAAGWYTGARHDGRIDDVYVDDDGSARGRCGACVDLDDYVSVAASEPAPARADDGTRVEGNSAGAEPRHGWSVSATRTIGNVEPYLWDWLRVGASVTMREGGHCGQHMRVEALAGCDVLVRGPDFYGWVANKKVRPLLTATDLDAVRDVPVMPDETPLADMAKPDEAMRFTSPSECDACSAPNPVGRACTCGGNPERCVREPPRVKVRTWTQGSATCGAVFVRAFVDGDSRECVSSPLAPPVLPRDPSPGVCPTCRVQRRERGEVRVHYWRCGCAVRPVGTYQKEIGFRERGWRAMGFGVLREHPTEAGAVSAWREALASAQREEDACR